MAIQDGALRTEVQKGTNVGTYDGAMRTEADKDAGAPAGGFKVGGVTDPGKVGGVNEANIGKIGPVSG